jgi:squalene-hopene/tetraprenyl-beta-curcumene cyclase
VHQTTGFGPGGWAFEFVNNWYPDIDDSAVVLMALQEGSGDPGRHETALKTGIAWCLGMQSKNGGFAAFDADNTKEWLNAIPFADLKALSDPPTEDVTGRILEMMGAFGFTPGTIPPRPGPWPLFRRTQHPDGSWWGRWGVNYMYGTWSVLVGLRAIGEDMQAPYIRRAVDWLKDQQNPDGGWGECCACYRDPANEGVGVQHRLPDGLGPHGPHGRRGNPLAGSQSGRPNTWSKTRKRTAAGMKNTSPAPASRPTFMIRYHLYRDVLPPHGPGGLCPGAVLKESVGEGPGANGFRVLEKISRESLKPKTCLLFPQPTPQGFRPGPQASQPCALFTGKIVPRDKY